MKNILNFLLFISFFILCNSIVQNWDLESHALDLLEGKDFISVPANEDKGYDMYIKLYKRIEKKSRSCSNGKVHAFNNKVFCSNCGRVFYKCGKSQENGFAYLCCKDKKDKWANCDNKKYLREEDLHNFVLYEGLLIILFNSIPGILLLIFSNELSLFVSL